MTSSTLDPNRGSPGSKPDNADNETPKQKTEEHVQDAKRELGAKAREKAEAGQHRAADEVDALSDAIDAAASNLDDHDREGLARYARELSSNLSNAAGQLEGRSVDELASDAKRLARNNPGMFMLGSIAVGFGLSRFFKASAEHDHHDDNAHPTGTQSTDAYQSNDTFKNDTVSTGTPMQQREQDLAENYTTSTAPRSGDGRDTL